MGAWEEAEQALRDKCLYAGLSRRDTDMCVDYFINKLCHKEMGEKYCIELQTSLNKKLKFKERLREF